MVSSWIVEQVNKLDPALGQAHLFNDEQNAVRRKEYFVLVTTIRTSELNHSRQLEQRDLRRCVSQHNKAKTVMDVKRQRKEVYGEKQEKKKKKKNKVEEFQLAKPASLGSLASKKESGCWRKYVEIQ